MVGKKWCQVRCWLFIVDSVKSIPLSSVQAIGIGAVLVGEFGLFIDEGEDRNREKAGE